MTDQRIYQRAKRFVLQRARPIDYAQWCVHFEGASPDLVLNILSQFQNDDGGFGHGLEADFWNPLSSPMQTWAATEVIQSLAHTNDAHPIVLGILRYLESGVDFDGHTWGRTVSSNNDYPHAEWWSHQSSHQHPAEKTYNPTAALAGFALQFSKIGSSLHQRAKQIAAEAFKALLEAKSVEVHELSCFFGLFQCVAKSKSEIGMDIAAIEQTIVKLVNSSITRDTSKWSTDYVCRPSRFIRHRNDLMLSGNEEIVRHECDFLRQTQLEDGSWPVNWRWSSFPNEWPIAREWWRSVIVIENLQFLTTMAEI